MRAPRLISSCLRRLTGSSSRGAAASPPPTEGTVSVLVFADIVSSTSRAAAVGDVRWRGLLNQFRRTARTLLGRFGGTELDAVGDGVFAAFESASAAISYACALRDEASELALSLRIGIHAGECPILDGSPCGLSVHLAARVADVAEPGVVLATGTVRELVLGWPIAFGDRGERTLREVPGRWQLYEVTSDSLTAAA